MTIIVAMVILFAIFFLIRKHIGPAMLAVIAGLCIFETFGSNVTDALARLFTDAPAGLIKNIVYLALVLILPLILYFRSGRGGLFGLLRIVEALVLAALLTSLCSNQLAAFFNFDDTSRQILAAIENYKSIILAVGTGFAYFDVLFYRSSD